MKIVLVNYRYFISGGPERYYFNVKEVLENHGHTVIPFSIKGSRNFPTDYEKYFLDAVDDEVYFAQSKKSLRVVLKSFSRMFWSKEAKRKFRKLLLDEKPDLVYIMQMHNKISPSIVWAARKLNVPVVHRISDFQYMCPNALFYNSKGVCEDCLEGKLRSCVKNKCVLDSRVYSAIKAGAKFLHDKKKVAQKIDAFVVPSIFTLGKLEKYGVKREKLNHIPTFFNLKEENPEVTYEPYMLYVGRLEKQKGLMTLLKAFAGSDMALKIIGFSNDGYDLELKEFLKEYPAKVEFLGQMTFDQMIPYLKSCRATVVPSEWYDNFPNAILESFAYKKCVVATDFGSLPELVSDGQTGFTFPYGDSEALRAACAKLLDDEKLARTLGNKAFEVLKKKYLPQEHYIQLMNLFHKLTDNE